MSDVLFERVLGGSDEMQMVCRSHVNSSTCLWASLSIWT